MYVLYIMLRINPLTLSDVYNLNIFLHIGIELKYCKQNKSRSYLKKQKIKNHNLSSMRYLNTF